MEPTLWLALFNRELSLIRDIRAYCLVTIVFCGAQSMRWNPSRISSSFHCKINHLDENKVKQNFESVKPFHCVRSRRGECHRTRRWTRQRFAPAAVCPICLRRALSKSRTSHWPGGLFAILRLVEWWSWPRRPSRCCRPATKNNVNPQYFFTNYRI